MPKKDFKFRMYAVIFQASEKIRAIMNDIDTAVSEDDFATIPEELKYVLSYAFYHLKKADNRFREFKRILVEEV